MSKSARRAETDRILAQDSDLAYVFRKINELGTEPQPIKVDTTPPPAPIREAPDPQPIYVRPDPKPLGVPPVEPPPDKIMAEILRMWPLLSERDKLELQGICQLKIYLNSRK